MKIPTADRSSPLPHRIVVPHDLTLKSRRALRMAAALARPLHSEVILLHVIEPGEGPPGAPPSEKTPPQCAQAVWRLLDEEARQFLPANARFRIRILSGNARTLLPEEVRRLQPNLLVVTLGPEGAIRLHGKAHALFKDPPCPVVSIRTREEEAVPLGEEFHRPEGLNHYCRLARLRAKRAATPPVYTGYSYLPAYLSPPPGEIEADFSTQNERNAQ